MKKFFSAFVLITLFGIFNNDCLAKYYDDDPNYIFFGVWGSGQYYHYWYLPSLDVQVHNPPYYQIGAVLVVIGGREEISENRDRAYIRYNWNTRESFSYIKGYWKKDDLAAPIMGNYLKKRANSLFYAAYGINFYGY